MSPLKRREPIKRAKRINPIFFIFDGFGDIGVEKNKEKIISTMKLNKPNQSNKASGKRDWANV